LVGEGATVGHLCVVHGAVIGTEALVGNGATVLDGAVIGPRALVAAGATVPPGMTAPSPDPRATDPQCPGPGITRSG
jgi:carbonic anhydrase/acetyltransferase-like protein (isoleucine patch superfamily)